MEIFSKLEFGIPKVIFAEGLTLNYRKGFLSFFIVFFFFEKVLSCFIGIQHYITPESHEIEFQGYDSSV